jgi:starch-binding outer membrane protein SusE/F
MSTINYMLPLKDLRKWTLTLLVLAAAVPSCKKTEDFSPSKVNAPLALSTSSDSAIVLNEANKYNTALTFNWTTGGNYGTGASISYTLEIDKKGGNFSNGVKTNLGKNIYTLNYTAGALNTLLTTYWHASPDTALQLQARIVDSISATGVKSDTSAILYLSIAPYKPVSTTLYILGDATDNGTNPATADSMTADPAVPGLFHFQGTLTPGHFKFITTLGSLLPSYNRGADSNHVILRKSVADPDSQFLVARASVYKISVNLIGLTISYIPAALPLYSQLWIVGAATPNGWNIDVPNKMFVDPFNQFIFHYNEVLAAGEFKIPTDTGNWNGDFYRPLTDDPPITDTAAVLVPGATNPPDNKWNITSPGPYKISLNISANSIQIVPFVPYTQLWMVGDATPVGWNINTPQPMTPTPGDPYTFTYSGPLTVGEFKIPVTTGNFGCPYFRPTTNHPSITDTLAPFVPVNQNPADVNDFKWYISVAGTYKVTLNQLYETITIQQQ